MCLLLEPSLHPFVLWLLLNRVSLFSQAEWTMIHLPMLLTVDGMTGLLVDMVSHEFFAWFHIVIFLLIARITGMNHWHLAGPNFLLYSKH
jgi:hypothetical protein